MQMRRFDFNVKVLNYRIRYSRIQRMHDCIMQLLQKLINFLILNVVLSCWQRIIYYVGLAYFGELFRSSGRNNSRAKLCAKIVDQVQLKYMKAFFLLSFSI